MEDRVLIGTELKYKVEIEASGFSMDENDFTVEVRRGTRSKLFEKPDMIILDPPRDGIHPKAIGKIIDYGVKYIRRRTSYRG